MTSIVVARLVCAVAAPLIVLTGVLASGGSPMAIPFIIWGLVPYGVLYASARVIVNPWVIGGAGVAALTVEAGVRASVMLFPRGSTAAIALVFSPVLILIAAMPAGAALGWVIGYLVERTGLVARALLVAASAAILGLTFIAFARPELFPTTVMARRDALEAIGEPRVVAGSDRFARTFVSEARAWKIVGEFNGLPGGDFATVDHKGAQLFDVATLKPTRFVAFGGEPGRVWGPFSTLIRNGDGYLIANTGGGYSEIEVKTLDGQRLWRFQPDPKLPPTAMLPADLDQDGEVEFYASSTDAITRLDAEGTEAWRKPSTLPQLVATVPGDEAMPSWVVSARYGMNVEVWRPDGQLIATVDTKDSPVHGVVEWLSLRSILVGQTSAKGVDLEGKTRFEIPIDEPMRLVQGVGWKPTDTSPAMLAIVTAGDLALSRWRLRVYESPQAVVYDEVFDRWVHLQTVRSATGTTTLLVSDAETLTVLRPAP